MYNRVDGWILLLKTQQVNNIAEQTWSLIKTQSADCECYHNLSISTLWLLVIMTRRFACASKCTKRPLWRVNMCVFELHPSKRVFAFSSLLRRHRELQHAPRPSTVKHWWRHPGQTACNAWINGKLCQRRRFVFLMGKEWEVRARCDLAVADPVWKSLLGNRTRVLCVYEISLMTKNNALTVFPACSAEWITPN